MKSEKIDKTMLVNRWYHSKEEDNEKEMVFRPEQYDFPLARSRIGFELNADNTCSEINIGAADKPAASPGVWELKNDIEPKILLRVKGNIEQEMTIKYVQEDCLVIKK